jgi:hypothetical protein
MINMYFQAYGKHKQKMLAVNVGRMNYSYREQKYKHIKWTGDQKSFKKIKINQAKATFTGRSPPTHPSRAPRMHHTKPRSGHNLLFVLESVAQTMPALLVSLKKIFSEKQSRLGDEKETLVWNYKRESLDPTMT